MESVPGFLNQGIDDTQRGIAKAVSAIMGGDAAGAIDKLSNRAQNRFLESMFDSVGFRKFSYTFKFTPKNVNESFIARDIIKTFRFHMTPELPETGDFGRYFVIPAEFDLFYMFRGDENTWLNKISSCVLTNMDVNYAEFMEQGLEGPYLWKGEAYFFDRKVNGWYSVSSEDYVDDAMNAELGYNYTRDGHYKKQFAS